MLTPYGLNAFLTALGKPYECRLWTSGCRVETLFPCDTGYPRLADTDVANPNRGPNVLTWRYTIPRGTNWGASPADEAELVDGPHVVDRMPIPHLTPSADYPTVLYLNMLLRRS